jgi:cold shock CspA family protein
MPTTPRKTSAKTAASGKASTKKKAAARTANRATPGTKATVKKRPANKVSVATAEPPVGGQISSWDPSSGQGLVTVGTGEDLAFDVFQTNIENDGYVDLHVGRAVKVSKYSNTAVRSFRAE